MHQIGIIDYWDTWFRPMPPQCNGEPQSEKTNPNNKVSRLNLKNLTGAFVVLLVGLSLSLLTFLCEIIISKLNRKWPDAIAGNAVDDNVPQINPTKLMCDGRISQNI
jgi:hypothetical protein